jgi:hypothetical protein
MSAGAVSDGIDGHAAVRAENGVFAIDGRGRVGEADVPARAIAFPAAAVIPAARVLRHVAADRSLIADLRRGRQFGAFREQAELLLHHRIADHLGQRGHGADLEAAVNLFDAAQFFDLAQVDYKLGA